MNCPRCKSWMFAEVTRDGSTLYTCPHCGETIRVDEDGDLTPKHKKHR